MSLYNTTHVVIFPGNLAVERTGKTIAIAPYRRWPWHRQPHLSKVYVKNSFTEEDRRSVLPRIIIVRKYDPTH